MNHYFTLGCFYIAGTYNGGESIIDYNNGKLRGRWLTVNRPNFTGYVSANCKGKITFPDDTNYKLEFGKVLNKILFTSGKPWTKGNLFFYGKSLVKIYQKKIYIQTI